MTTVKITTAQLGWYIVHSNGTIADWRTFVTKEAAEVEISQRRSNDDLRAIEKTRG
jgi:hypothetical protein